MGVSLLVNLILRGLQGLFALVCLGLSGYIIATLSSEGFTWGSCALALCTALLSGLVVAFVLVTMLIFKNSKTARPLVHLILDALCCFLWLCSFAAVAAGKDSVWLLVNMANVYALIGLGALEWLLFGATAVINIIDVINRKKTSKTQDTTPMQTGYQGSYDAPVSAASYGQSDPYKQPYQSAQPAGSTYYPSGPAHMGA